MQPPTEHRPVFSSAIDLADRTYFFAPEHAPPTPELIHSIRAWGILHPPLLREREGRYQVLAGWKRLLAAIEFCGWEVIPAIVVPSSWPSFALYDLLLEQSLLGTPLSPAEQSSFFASLVKFCPSEDLLPLLARLGYRPTEQLLAELIALGDLAPPVLVALHRGRLGLAGARKLLRLPRSDQETLVALITQFQLGGSKQQRLIELAIELVRRRDLSLPEILAPFLQKQDEASQDNRPQQAATLLSWLHGECFPSSSKAERAFSRKVAQLHLPADMEVTHSPSFEEDSITLSITFPDWQTLLRALPTIRERLQEPTRET